MKFIPKGLIYNIPSLVLITVRHQPGNKPLSEPMMINLLTHITQPQWANSLLLIQYQDITWSKDDLLSNGTLGTNISYIFMEI